MRWTKLLNGRKAKITALCDTDEYRLNTYGDKYEVDKSNRYLNEVDFFKAGKLADAIYICPSFPFPSINVVRLQFAIHHIKNNTMVGITSMKRLKYSHWGK